MQRHSRWLMLGLLFCMGLSLAGPLVKPKSITLVCTATQPVVLVVVDSEGMATKPLTATLDCPDCLPVVLLPPDIAMGAVEKPIQGDLAAIPLTSVSDAHCLPPPARGPPLLSVSLT